MPCHRPDTVPANGRLATWSAKLVTPLRGWSMPDDAAASRAAAEEESAFSHPSVAPDATRAYGDHPDQVIDFYAPRGESTPGGAPLVVVLHGGAWRAPYDRHHITPFADSLAARGFA